MSETRVQQYNVYTMTKVNKQLTRDQSDQEDKTHVIKKVLATPSLLKQP